MAPNTRSPFHEVAAVTLVLLLAALLRISFLDSKSLWFDEAYSYEEAIRTQSEIWTAAPQRTDSHPPLYYSALHFWVRAAGTSEFALRYFSVLTAVLNIALLYALAKRLLDKRAALLAAALLAVSPLDIWYAQETRMYIFMATAVLLAALILTWPRWPAAVFLGAVLGLGLYLDYTMAALWIGLTVLWLVYWWEHGHPLSSLLIWCTATLIALALYSLWINTFFAWLERLSEVTIYLRISTLTGLPSFSAWQYLLFAALAGLFAAPLLAWFRRQVAHSSNPQRPAFLFLALFSLATLLFVFPRFYSIKRLIVQIWPLVVLTAAWAIMQVPARRQVAAALFTGCFALSVITVIAVEKDDWRSAIAYANNRYSAEDVALLEHPWNSNLTRYYGLSPAMAALESLRTADQSTAQSPAAVWYFVERFPGEGEDTAERGRWLDENYHLLEVVRFPRLEIRRYAPPRDGQDSEFSRQASGWQP